MKAKQFNRGIDQLIGEGVAQLFISSSNGRRIIETVRQLQFEVIQYRLLYEYGIDVNGKLFVSTKHVGLKVTCKKY
ncbi:MAG: hypothetical protein Pg6B_06060 [Candidatus Azobacteroides pseudotrichonymphae]|jgi:peptide subunit release factor RF-3|nr:MAG: hypothetical protein Pg6B_06060 [Candidatus Azobacteroides pseudotrichonymphae]